MGELVKLTQPSHYLRLSAQPHGALLWPTEEHRHHLPESVATRVYVAGIFWYSRAGQAHYGVDFAPSVSNDRDRDKKSEESYRKWMATIINHY